MASCHQVAFIFRSCNATVSCRGMAAWGRNRYSYNALHKWSIENKNLFWKKIWKFTNIIGELKGNIYTCEIVKKDQISIKNSKGENPDNFK